MLSLHHCAVFVKWPGSRQPRIQATEDVRTGQMEGYDSLARCRGDGNRPRDKRILRISRDQKRLRGYFWGYVYDAMIKKLARCMCR